MKRVLQTIFILLTLAISLTAYALWANKVPWKEPPGILTRLQVYISQNTAETGENSIFPELRPPVYWMAARRLFDELTLHVIALDWNIVSVDADKLELTATAQSRWLKFTDDISIRLQPLSEKQTRLHIRSASRLGSADFGANLAHIIKLNRSLQSL